MTIVPNELDIEITDATNSVEIEVEVDYRCFIEENVAFAPVTVTGSIFNGYTLQTFINNWKKHYEKDNMKVQIMEVRIGEMT